MGGWFGDPHQGVYVSQASDYCLKYSHGQKPLAIGDEVRIMVFKVLPGRVYHCNAVTLGLHPVNGFDSHESPHHLEWYLPMEGQSCPLFVLKVKAMEKIRQEYEDDHESN